MKKLYEVSQVVSSERWVRVKAENEEEALNLAIHENCWNETDVVADTPAEVNLIQEISV